MVSVILIDTSSAIFAPLDSLMFHFSSITANTLIKECDRGFEQAIYSASLKFIITIQPNSMFTQWNESFLWTIDEVFSMNKEKKWKNGGFFSS